MEESTTLPIAGPSTGTRDAPTDLLRDGAWRLVTPPIDAEVVARIDAHAHLEDPAGRRQIVRNGHLFRSVNRHRKMTCRPLTSRNALDMIKGKAKALGLPETIDNHMFRATGITVFRQNGGTIEEAQHIANHASPTTMLDDRSRDQITLGEVEKNIV